jgi:hypothetical protein
MKINTDTDFDLYCRIRNNWIDSDEGLASWRKGTWSKDFDNMLKRYSARTVMDGAANEWPLVADGVGIVIGKEHIVFDNREDYTLFLLRWS